MAKSVEVKGMRELIKNLQRMQPRARTELEKAMVKCAIKISNDYRNNVRRAGLIDTGLWISSITYQLNNFGTDKPGFSVGSPITNPPYPEFHEFGTTKFPATPTLQPAYDKNVEFCKRTIAKAMKRALR